MDHRKVVFEKSPNSDIDQMDHLLPGGSGLLLLVRHLPPELRTQLQELVLVLTSLEGGTWKLG